MSPSAASCRAFHLLHIRPRAVLRRSREPGERRRPAAGQLRRRPRGTAAERPRELGSEQPNEAHLVRDVLGGYFQRLTSDILNLEATSKCSHPSSCEGAVGFPLCEFQLAAVGSSYYVLPVYRLLPSVSLILGWSVGQATFA